MKKILFMFLAIVLLTGCNYRELNDLAIVTGISIDKVEDDYEVLVQVVNPTQSQESSSSEETDFVTYTSQAKSLQEALRTIILECPRRLYGSQLQILLISEDLAKEDLDGILDFFFRDPEFRLEFLVAIEKDANNQALKTLTTLDNLTSSNIQASLEADSAVLGNSYLVTNGDLINMYLDENLEIVLPSLSVVGNDEEGEEDENLRKSGDFSAVVISDLGIFKDNKLIGYLSKDESIAYNFVMGNIQNTLISYECDDNRHLVSEIIRTNTSLKADVKKKKITIEITGDASINECNCNYDLTKTDVIDEINEKVNKRIEELISESIKKVQKEYNTDIYGFRNLFYKTDYKEYKKIKDKWYEEVFPNLEVEVKANVELIEKGNVLGGIYDKQKD